MACIATKAIYNAYRFSYVHSNIHFKYLGFFNKKPPAPPYANTNTINSIFEFIVVVVDNWALLFQCGAIVPLLLKITCFLCSRGRFMFVQQISPPHTHSLQELPYAQRHHSVHRHIMNLWNLNIRTENFVEAGSPQCVLSTLSYWRLSFAKR